MQKNPKQEEPIEEETTQEETIKEEAIKEEPKFKKLISGANDLSLGISIVVAVLIGVGIGFGLYKLTGIIWLFWLGVAWGIGAAILNIYKAYKRTKKELEKLAQDPKYSYKKDDVNV